MAFLEATYQGFLPVFDAIASSKARSLNIAYLCSIPFHSDASKACVQPCWHSIGAFNISDILGVFHEAMDISIVGVLSGKLNIMVTLMIWVEEA